METKTNLDKLVEMSESAGKNNYVAWRFKMNLILRSKKLFDVATGITQKPSDQDSSYTDWCNKDLEAQTIIALSIDEKIALKISKCMSAASMITRLETLYGSKTQSSIESLRMQFFGYVYNSNKSVTENCLEIDNLAQEIWNLNEKVKDEWIVSKILNCLPEKYNHFHSAWDSLAETDKTLSKLIDRLQQEEKRMTSRDCQNSSSALVTKGKQGSKFKSKDPQSTSKTNQQGHKTKCF